MLNTMHLRVGWCVAVATLVVGGGTALGDDETDLGPSADVLCHGTHALAQSADAKAEFVLRSSGQLEVGSDADSAPDWATGTTFTVDANSIVRVVAAGGEGEPQNWCGYVDKHKTYYVPTPSSSMVSIEMYKRSANPPEAMAAARTAVFARAEAAERSAVYRLKTINEQIGAMRHALGDTTSLDKVADYAKRAVEALGNVQKKWSCSNLDRDNPLAPAVCEEVAKATTTLLQIRTIASRATARQAHIADDRELIKDVYEVLPALVATFPTVPAAFSEVERVAECNTLAKLRWYDDPAMARLAARATVPFVPRSQLVTVSFGAAPFTVYGADFGKPWGLAMTDVPTGTKTSFAAYAGTPLSIDPKTVISTIASGGKVLGGGGVTFAQLRSTASANDLNTHKLDELPSAVQEAPPRSLICTPLNEKGVAEDAETQLQTIQQRLLSVYGDAAPNVENLRKLAEKAGRSELAKRFQRADSLDSARLAGVQLQKLSPADADIKRELEALVATTKTRKDTAQRSFDELVVRIQDSTDPEYVVDVSLAPTAAVETVSKIYRNLDPSHVQDLVACIDVACSAVDDKNVRGHAKLTPIRTESWTMLAELSFGYGIASRYSTAKWNYFTTQGFKIQGAPSFDAVNRGDGTDQLYELEQRIDPRNAFSTAVLVGRYFTDRWAFAAGPALLVGTSGAAFTQWNAHFARRLGTKSGVFLTFGPSLRFLQAPVDYELGDLVSVSKSMAGVATPPAPRTYFTPELQFDIGLGIDLGTLGNAAADTLKSFGGK